MDIHCNHCGRVVAQVLYPNITIDQINKIKGETRCIDNFNCLTGEDMNPPPPPPEPPPPEEPIY